MASAVEIRELARHELARIGEIDRSEVIDALVEQHGTELVERPGQWTSPPWDPDGTGEHSVAAQLRAVVGYVEAGGVALGALSDGRLVGIGVVVPNLRPGIAQLAYLHVSHGSRASGIGTRLVVELERIARHAGDTEMVVSATRTANTVRFYQRRGYRPTADPLPELLELEPVDVHMRRDL